MTTAAAKATAAADALRAWLHAQPPPVFQRRGAAAQVPAQPEPDAPHTPGADDPAGLLAALAGAPPAVDAGPESPGPEPRRSATQSSAPDITAGAPLRLAHTDWLYHRLAIAGPPVALAAFRAAAAGAGVIPWHLDGDRLEEDCFHRLVAPAPPQQRSLSATGARIVARQLRDAVARRHELAVARVGQSRACPFDLHALVPVPAAVLRCGSDDPVSLAWLWQHWGTTRDLRHVTAETVIAAQERRRQPEADTTGFRVTFWSADWSPWHALTRIAADWPTLRFDLQPRYEPP